MSDPNEPSNTPAGGTRTFFHGTRADLRPVDDPNLTDKKFPGNPTKSYRSREPLRVVAEHVGWEGHSPEEIQAMKDGIAGLQPVAAAG